MPSIIPGLRQKFFDTFGFDYRDCEPLFDFRAKMGAQFLSDNGSTGDLSTQEIPALKETKEKTQPGFGRKFRARLKRERTARLLDATNRAKNSLITKIRHDRTREEKAELHRTFERELNNAYGTHKRGAKDNFRSNGTPRFKKPLYEGNRYSLTTKHLQDLADKGRIWANKRLCDNQFLGRRTTADLPEGRFGGFRSNLERKLNEVKIEQLRNPERLRYTEHIALPPVEQYVDWMGYVQPYTPDFVHDTEAERIYVEVKGTNDILARLKKAIFEENEQLYRETRKDVLRVGMRIFSNLNLYGYHTKSYIPELLYLAGPTIDLWKRESCDLSSKGFSKFVKADSESFVEFINDIFQAFFAEEAEVWQCMAEKVQCILDQVPVVELEDGSWPVGDILDLIQRSLAQAKTDCGYDDSEKGIRKRFRINRMNDEYRTNLAQFKAYRSTSSKGYEQTTETSQTQTTSRA
jgi:hypothetical protein